MNLLHEPPHRPDADVLHDVVERIEEDSRCRNARVGVTVVDDVVALTGEVASLAQKRRVELVAHRVAGVRAVASELIAVSPESPGRNDCDLARDVAARLRVRANPDGVPLVVTVSHGVVTLEGRVDWPYQRQQAVEAVADLAGVDHVEDRIRLTERVAAWDVRRGIAAELQRQAARAAHGVRVDVEDNRVTLDGRVRSAQEKIGIERAAWGVSGVLDVRNRLEVAE